MRGGYRPRNKQKCFQSKYVESSVGDHVVISAEADHSGDEESDANCNDTQVPNRPEVRYVKSEASVPKLDEFCQTWLVVKYDAASPLRLTIVSERRQPDVKHDFRGGHSME
jgi:hypothetical protein